MKRELNVLLLEDNRSDVELIRRVLSSAFDVGLNHVDSQAGFLDALHSRAPDVIISDFSLPKYNGKDALADAQSLQPETPFIFYSGTIGEEVAIDALKLGAIDYVLKDKPRRLINAIERALEEVEQKKRQQEAEQKITSQAQLLDLATDAIIVRDLEDHVLFWSKGAERLYGFTGEEVEGVRIGDLLFLPPATQLAEAKATTLREGHWEGELHQVTKSRRRLVVTSRWTLVRNAQGTPERILTINTDVTERKDLEKQFLRAQRLESIGTLASGIAHDLNNILAPIFMASEILESEQLSPESRDMLEIVRTSAQRGAEVVKQVLTFVRGSDGKRSAVSIEHLLREVGRIASDTFPKNIKTRCELGPRLPAVQGDATQLHQVLMNLVINARDAMPEGGRLHLTARELEQEQVVIISVQDTGTGIPAEVLDKVFDPFFTTKDAGKGTGLGLSTALGIVKSHGGTMQVKSDLGAGTVFEIRLPIMRTQVGGPAPAQARRAKRGQGELILVVEDEERIRKVLAHALVEQGYRVITSENGSSGIVQFFANKKEVRVVLTDMQMPLVDGGSLAKAIRAVNAEVKVIGTTGSLENGTIEAADRVLRKPFQVEELFRAIEEVLESR